MADRQNESGSVYNRFVSREEYNARHAAGVAMGEAHDTVDEPAWRCPSRLFRFAVAVFVFLIVLVVVLIVRTHVVR